MRNCLLPVPVTTRTEVTATGPLGPASETSAGVKLAGAMASEKFSRTPVTRPPWSIH